MVVSCDCAEYIAEFVINNIVRTLTQYWPEENCLHVKAK